MPVEFLPLPLTLAQLAVRLKVLVPYIALFLKKINYITFALSFPNTRPLKNPGIE
jgi:hypothetical protein